MFEFKLEGKTVKRILGIIALASFIVGCAPAVGSDEWCKDMEEKPKGDWSTNEATDYAKHCVFKD